MNNIDKLNSIDNKISTLLHETDEIINELNEQNNIINNITYKIINYENILNISKTIYNKTTSFLCSIDYFNLYNRYKNHNKIEEIELLELNNENIYLLTVNDTEDTEDNIISKLIIVRNKTLYINDTLDKQNNKLHEQYDALMKLEHYK